MRNHIVAGNWKMNKNLDEGLVLIQELSEKLTDDIVDNTNVVIAPTHVMLGQAVAELWDNPNIAVAAQNCHFEDAGAYTGEVSAAMIAALEADAVILGHSERREYFGETNALIAQKVKKALEHDLIPIYCCGEVLAERKNDQHFDVVRKQVEEGLFDLDESAFANVVIAYEPVWAIGTGETATPEQAQEIHAFIRQIVAEKYGEKTAKETSILYGGSCKPSNARELFSQPDVDGGLIGGASLKSDDFTEIVKAMEVKR